MLCRMSHVGSYWLSLYIPALLSERWGLFWGECDLWQESDLQVRETHWKLTPGGHPLLLPIAKHQVFPWKCIWLLHPMSVFHSTHAMWHRSTSLWVFGVQPLQNSSGHFFLKGHIEDYWDQLQSLMLHLGARPHLLFISLLYFYSRQPHHWLPCMLVFVGCLVRWPRSSPLWGLWLHGHSALLTTLYNHNWASR